MPNMMGEILDFRDHVVAQSLAPAEEPRRAWGEGKAAVVSLEEVNSCYERAGWEACPECYGTGTLSCDDGARACQGCLGGGEICDQCGAAGRQDGVYGQDGYESEGRGGCMCRY